MRVSIFDSCLQALIGLESLQQNQCMAKNQAIHRVHSREEIFRGVDRPMLRRKTSGITGPVRQTANEKSLSNSPDTKSVRFNEDDIFLIPSRAEISPIKENLWYSSDNFASFKASTVEEVKVHMKLSGIYEFPRACRSLYQPSAESYTRD